MKPIKPINTQKDFSQINQTTAGQQRLQTLVQLEARKYLMYVLVALCPMILVVGLCFYLMSSYDMYAYADLYLKACFTLDNKAHVWILELDSGRVFYPTMQVGYSKFQPHYTANQLVELLWRDSYAPLVVNIIFMISTLPSLIAIKKLREYFMERGDTSGELLRGGQLISKKDYLEQAADLSGLSEFTFGGIQYPFGAEFLGTLIVGAAGSGKSNEYKPSMERAFDLGYKVIIFDPTGEDTVRYFRPGKDILLAPANTILETTTGEVIQPTGWSLLSEIHRLTDIGLVANSFIPLDPKDKGNFFQMGAQQVFGEVLGALRKKNVTSSAEIYDIFSSIDRREELTELLRNSPANRILGKEGSGQSDGVFGSISNYLSGLKLVQDGDFSVRNFVRDQQSDARLFICAKDAREILMPLYRVAITLALNELSLMPPANGRVRCCFFIDELPALGYLEKLAPALQEMRKYGALLMCVCQSLSQIRHIYGEDGGRNLYSAFQNLAVYRLPSKREQEEASGMLGEQEVLERQTNFSLAVQNDRDGVSQNTSVVQRPIVHFSELHLLKVGQCYLRFAGFNPMLLDSSLYGEITDLVDKKVVGDVSVPHRTVLIRKDSVIVASGTSDANGRFEIELTDSYQRHELVVLMPPIFETHNDGLELLLNPALELSISSLPVPMHEDKTKTLDQSEEFKHAINSKDSPVLEIDEDISTLGGGKLGF
jgi:hypothetical protein